MRLDKLLKPMTVKKPIKRPNRSLTQEFVLQLKDLGIDCHEGLESTMDKRWKRQAKKNSKKTQDRDNSEEIYFNRSDIKVLHFILTTLTSHLLLDSIRDSTEDQVKNVLVDNSLYKSIVNKITLFQHSLMLRFGFKIDDISIREDIFLKYGTVTPDKNFKYYTLEYFEMRTTLVGRLVERLKEKYKMLNVDNVTQSVESQFIRIYNDCCIDLKQRGEMIGNCDKKRDNE